jgi:glycosyltransferase involved in cell wall biosynthesis
MEIYANQLTAALEGVAHEKLVIRQFVPKVSRIPWKKTPVGSNELRWSRYIAYPLLARTHQSEINHVLEHGYAHLLWTLDPKRTVVTVHDLIPLARWSRKISGVSRGSVPLLNLLSVKTLRRARYLIAISQSTARDLVELCGCDPQTIRVVPYGLSDAFAPRSPDGRRQLRSGFGFPGCDTYLVLISGHAFYKNHAACAHALKALLSALSRPIKFVRLGRQDLDWEAAVRALGLTDHIIEIPELPPARVPELYNSVDCLLFPSLYEGFGWPVLEAMACGIPVVSSDAASLPEVGGNASILVKATDVSAMARAVKDVLENQELKRSLIERGHEQAARFRWSDHASALMRVYEEILEKQ